VAKNFFSEIRRLDTSDDDFFMSLSNDTSVTIESFGDLPQAARKNAFINSTIAGRMALYMDKPKNQFSNNDVWELYGDIEDVDDWRVTPVIKDNLAICMTILEMENILSFEAEQDTSTSDDTDLIRAFDKLQINYRKKVIATCYKNGRFETENWRVEVSH
jgi:hypothetical protein